MNCTKVISSYWFDEERMHAVNRVILELDTYKGEKIVADEHPLHKAIVLLEGLVDTMMEYRERRKQNLLLKPAMGFWFRLVRSSRTDTVDLSECMMQAIKLKEELITWKSSEPNGWADRCNQQMGIQ